MIPDRHSGSYQVFKSSGTGRVRFIATIRPEHQSGCFPRHPNRFQTFQQWSLLCSTSLDYAMVHVTFSSSNHFRVFITASENAPNRCSGQGPGHALPEVPDTGRTDEGRGPVRGKRSTHRTPCPLPSDFEALHRTVRRAELKRHTLETAHVSGQRPAHFIDHRHQPRENRGCRYAVVLELVGHPGTQVPDGVGGFK